MNYPNGINKTSKNIISNSNRGMTLESMINNTNDYYIANDIAYIYKKPIPIQVVEVDYKNRKQTMIKKAFYTTPSTTDYNGLYKGYYIDFEAKECNSKTSFALSNLHNHQFLHLHNICKHNGIGFIIIKFSYYNEVFLLEFNKLNEFIINNDRKSIPYKWIILNSYKINESFRPQLDYLKCVDLILEKRYKNE